MVKADKDLQKHGSNSLLNTIRILVESARQSVIRTIDSAMTVTYILIGRHIVEDEQQGKKRAGYADETLKFLGQELTKEFGRGFSARNLASMKKFYLTYQNRVNIDPILQTTSAKFSSHFPLTWSHYLILCRIADENERNFYETEAINSNWTLTELERQYSSSVYERLLLSKNKKKIKELSEKGHIIENAADAVKNPYVLEFLGLKEESEYSESDLERAIINKLENFMLELGRGFLFVGRQVRFTFEEEHFFVDLVFFNRLLKCFVLIDLKIGKLKHQDIGQMQMYVNYYDRVIKTQDESKTIGIIICKDKKDAIIEMSLPEDNKQIFASKYQLYLPSKEELKKLIQ
jgi:predicted nuclease of restriction endonuclease-like (RecB) superfamily